MAALTDKPLAPAALNILLALSGNTLHGYGILKEIERQSGEQYRIGPGTLYDNLSKLIAEALVEDLPADVAVETLRQYRLTPSGIALLATELKRLESLLRIGRKRLRRLGAERA